MPKKQIFNILENILSTASDIHIMTQNQETIILHGTEYTMLSELAKNKQGKITKLDALEKQFESLYIQNKDIITERSDVIRLQELVSKIMEMKEAISKAEERNRHLWDGKGRPGFSAISIQKPQSYIIEQYKKHSKK